MKINVVLLALSMLVIGALVRDVVLPRAHATGAAVTSQDIERVVRALEQQTRATQDVARAIKEAARP